MGLGNPAASVQYSISAGVKTMRQQGRDKSNGAPLVDDAAYGYDLSSLTDAPVPLPVVLHGAVIAAAALPPPPHDDSDADPLRVRVPYPCHRLVRCVRRC